MSTKEISTRIGADEIGRIFHLKENLDHNEVVLSLASHYRRLGWALEATDATQGTPLGLNFSQPHVEWSQRLTNLGLERVQVNLRVRTGSPSRLLVLEVNQGEGALPLEQFGDWRAESIAALGDWREQHYYVLPPEASIPPSCFQVPQVLIYGEGGLTLVPPSREGQSEDPWRWVQPPWERPVGYPPPAVWQFLKERLPAVPGQPDVPSWQEIYRTVAPHGLILKALLFPAQSPAAYYQGILQAALNLGLKDATLLQGLLWHAPHGEARQRPERWEYLQELVARALEDPPNLPVVSDQGAPGPSPEMALAAAPLTPAQKPARNSLEVPGDLTLGQSPEGGEAAPAKFDQSVSGQFFQLLAGLGEKVIAESCRYEAMLAGLGTKGRDLESLVTEWEQAIGSPLPATGQGPLPAPKGEPGPLDFEWATAVNHQTQKKQQWAEVQEAARDFLQNHPDLAANRSNIQLVLFCLKNYISINPEWARLSFREKLEQAGVMARSFLAEASDP